jgi:hypothetical protein
MKALTATNFNLVFDQPAAFLSHDFCLPTRGHTRLAVTKARGCWKPSSIFLFYDAKKMHNDSPLLPISASFLFDLPERGEDCVL